LDAWASLECNARPNPYIKTTANTPAKLNPKSPLTLVKMASPPPKDDPVLVGEGVPLDEPDLVDEGEPVLELEGG
jgi:hypothetical protein